MLLLLAIALTASSSVAQLRAAEQDQQLSDARALIQEAQERYGRLPVGPASIELYADYYEPLGFGTASFIDFCATLITASLSRATTQQELHDEFQRTLGFREGLLSVYADLARQWGLDSASTPAMIDAAIINDQERARFKTALLADTVATVWSFVLGYQYFKLHGESPVQPSPVMEPATQSQVDERLRRLATEATR